MIAWISVAGGLLTSCTDETISINETPFHSQFEGKELVAVPLGISFEVASTRADDDNIIYGDYDDHAIDFEDENECYAIFFKTDGGTRYVKYITPLYYNKQLTDKYQPSSASPTAEYTVYALAYVPCEDMYEEIEGQKNTEKLTHVLVVLNGGPVYKKFHDIVYDEAGEVRKNIPANKILDVTWSNPLNINELLQTDWYDEDDITPYDYVTDGLIGRNIKNHYTMTNSAYYENNELMTMAKISGEGYVSVDEFIAAEAEPSAQVSVERMVAKFSTPVMPTEIIGGEERFFRPSTSIPKLVVYSWDDRDLQTREVDWRIHLLGWTINGRESENYVFKRISNTNYPSWPIAQWNKPLEKRSYWSEDPHYDNDADEEKRHFYPWQLRKAADTPKTVSLSAGVNNTHQKRPALRYLKFSEITWAPSFIVAPENTFNPQPEVEWDLDNRDAQLAGPHLLLTAELYFEGGRVPGVYLSNFGKEEHLYSDRLQRYYFSETDWFKMFVREFNKTLHTQNTMTFQLLNLDHPDTKWDCKLTAKPVGDCRLFYRHHESLWNEWEGIDSEKKERLKNEAISVEDTERLQGDKEEGKYYFTEITFDMIDLLDKGEGTFSVPAFVLQGDGRVMPWLENIKIKRISTVRNEEDNSLKLSLNRLDYDIIEGTLPDGALDASGGWSEEMYKSIFREWFGPVDHFRGGRMYYSGAIKHQTVSTGLDDDDSSLTYYGTVRNHWYKFTITAINGVGTPVSDVDQWIIPDKYGYNDQIAVQMEVLGWHPKSTFVGLGD